MREEAQTLGMGVQNAKSSGASDGRRLTSGYNASDAFLFNTKNCPSFKKKSASGSAIVISSINGGAAVDSLFMANNAMVKINNWRDIVRKNYPK